MVSVKETQIVESIQVELMKTEKKGKHHDAKLELHAEITKNQQRETAIAEFISSKNLLLYYTQSSKKKKKKKRLFIDM